ncbi:MAG TPA: prolyl oligopeptidase family serine peptidase, partial [Solirubrobacteraceae bacterium]|nr:prolyl oligopeptidase family serine peptidase [Solirubrobacteraceae bacterium]
FQLRNTGLQNQDVLYVMDGPMAEGRVLLDPNELSEDGTVALSDLAVTDDGELLIYATSEGGSDWMTYRVREVSSGKDRADRVEWAKYSAVAPLKDASGFLYGAVDPPEAGAELLAAAEAHSIRLHRLGTPQSEDRIIMAAPEQPEWMFSARVSDDGRYAVIETTRGTAPETRLHVLDLAAPDATPVPLIDTFAAKTTYVTNLDSVFLLLTDAEAERGRLIAVDLEDPVPEHWRELIPESMALLAGARRCGDALVLHHLADASARLSVHGLDGHPVGEIALPGLCSLMGEGVHGRPSSSLVHFATVSFIDPGSLWEHDLATGATRQIGATPLPLDTSAWVSEQVFIPADDGTALPLFLTRRGDVVPDGDTPVLLYGYGGFDISLTPMFSPSWATFVDRGGMLAVAVLRGGGEYGRSWHRAGIHARKQRVFDDFRDCARWLVDSGWTAAKRIAIMGASNGGLLVGACLTQHPELFGAAVADVGVLDMLRFHRFTIGWAWKSDYGDPEDPEGFAVLAAYSPLHNVSAQRRYPPTLITTGDHDDRVVPGHSFKFAATMLAAAHARAERGQTPAPVLLRTATSAGHGHGMPTSKAIAKATDVLAFLTATVGAASA